MPIGCQNNTCRNTKPCWHCLVFWSKNILNRKCKEKYFKKILKDWVLNGYISRLRQKTAVISAGIINVISPFIAWNVECFICPRAVPVLSSHVYLAFPSGVCFRSLSDEECSHEISMVIALGQSSPEKCSIETQVTLKRYH